MRFFVQTQNQAGKTIVCDLARCRREISGDTEQRKTGWTDAASTRPGHDFNRIAVYPPAPVVHGPIQETNALPASVNAVLAGIGTPLESALRRDMEQRFNHDFSGVRLHSGALAEQSAHDVHANAYTAGRSIVFGAGRLAPETSEGRRLIGHELAHVVQQSRGGPRHTPAASDALEDDAARAASEIVQGHGIVRVAGAGAPEIAREPRSSRPPVPRVAHTPFHFISESPALENWKLAVKEMLEREYKAKFGTFEEAEKRFQEKLNGLPSTKAREAYADRMRDRARKAFYRQEGRKPSYAYTKPQRDRLLAGAAPIQGQQLEHLEEVKTKVREGIKVPGHPERALDPANLYYSEGGKGGTAPKGSRHGEKWRIIKAAVESSRQIRDKAPKPLSSQPAASKPGTSSWPKAGFDTTPVPSAAGAHREPPAATPAKTRPVANAEAPASGRGSLKRGRVTVDFDSSASKSAIKVSKIDLSDYPPDKEGLVSRFFKNDTLQKLTAGVSLGRDALSMAGQAAGGWIEEAIQTITEPIQSHFARALDEAQREFRERFPDANSLLRHWEIDRHRKAYEAAAAKLRIPDQVRLGAKVLLAFTPDKDLDAASHEMEQRLANVGTRPEERRNHQDSGAAYEDAMINLLAEMSEYEVLLPTIDEDIAKRALVLQHAAHDLEAAFWSVIQSPAALVPVIYYESFDIYRVAGIFQRLSGNMAGFAAEINSRTAEYQRVRDSLDEQLLRVRAQLNASGAAVPR